MDLANLTKVIAQPESTLNSITHNLKTPPEGWQASNRKNRRFLLSGIGVYCDEFVKLFHLKPEIGMIDGKKHELSWQVNSVYDDGDSYVSCSYNVDEV